MSEAPHSLERDEGIANLARVATALGARSIADEATALGERSRAGLFFVACVGQFKRGKSTLLNGLLDDSVLPMGVVPVTAAVTILRHGPRREARVRFIDGRTEVVAPEAIVSYVSEEENPENAKGVRGVEVFLPSPLLANGMCLVDTPGIGSVFSGNTSVTREFVPHIDAALVVLGADPPISGDELALVREVSQHVSELLFVLNKADRLPAADHAQAVRFTEKVLAKHLMCPAGRIFEISAVEPGARDWFALKGALESLARESGAALALQGSARQAQRLARALELEIKEHRAALLRPVEDSQARVARLRAHVEAGEQSLHELSHLLDAEQEQLTMMLTRKRAGFLSSAQAVAGEKLALAVAAEPRESAAKLRQRSFELAQEAAREALEVWRAEVQPLAEELYRKAEKRFVELANAFTTRLREAGEESTAPELEAETTFRSKSSLFYTELMTRTSASFLTWILDRLRTRGGATRAVSGRAREYLDQLLVTNTSRIMYDLVERTLESRRQLEAQVRRQILETVGRAERGLARAQERHALGAKEVEGELARLQDLAAALPLGAGQ